MEKSAHSKFYFSMSYYQKSSWACALLYDPCSRQETGDTTFAQKVCMCTMENFTLGLSQPQKLSLFQKLPLFKECSVKFMDEKPVKNC